MKGMKYGLLLTLRSSCGGGNSDGGSGGDKQRYTARVAEMVMPLVSKFHTSSAAALDRAVNIYRPALNPYPCCSSLSDRQLMDRLEKKELTDIDEN
jgi:hypothetical protein